MAERRTILIAGAGIGGLTAALASAEAGFKVVVCERASELSQLGAGIQISPNAGRVLASLGLEKAMSEVAVEPAGIDIANGLTGRMLTSIPAAIFRSRYGFPYQVVHRADLQAILAEAINLRPEITVRLGTTVGPVVAQSGGYLVRVERSGGSDVVPVAGVIGADGVWSTMRDRIAGTPKAHAVGRTAWRALIPVDNAPRTLPHDRVGLWLGPDAHLVHYPVARGSAINIVAIVKEEAAKASWTSPGDGKALAERFAKWSGGAREIVATPFSWQKFPIVTVEPTGRWVDGPLALLGDAAHAMSPFVAQGGAMAIEDAAVLARCLAGTREIPDAFAAYEAERKPRVVRAAKAAAHVGDIYHWSPPLSLFRDWALRLGGWRLVLWQNDWIYRWGAG